MSPGLFCYNPNQRHSKPFPSFSFCSNFRLDWNLADQTTGLKYAGLENGGLKSNTDNDKAIDVVALARNCDL